MNEDSTVMATPKANLVNVIPTKENVDYDRIYKFNSADALKKFKFLLTNRDINNTNVARILKQILGGKYGSRFIPCIIVDINTLAVVDGQNRYIAALRAYSEGSEEFIRVIFIDVPPEYMDELIRVLQDGKKWDNRDYFKRAIEKGNKACKTIREWCYQHSELCMTGKDNPKPNYSYAMSFIYGKRMDKEVKELTLTITKKQLEFAEQIYKEVLLIMKSMKYRRSAFLEGLTQAWYAIRSSKDNKNFFLEDMGLDYFTKHLYDVMGNYQTTTKKEEWLGRLHGMIEDIYRMYREGVAA